MGRKKNDFSATACQQRNKGSSFRGFVMFTWGFLRWIPLAVNEAATRHVDPALRQHKQRRDHRGKQSEEEAQGLQGWAACIERMAHQYQSLWMKGKGELIHWRVSDLICMRKWGQGHTWMEQNYKDLSTVLGFFFFCFSFSFVFFKYVTAVWDSHTIVLCMGVLNWKQMHDFSIAY